MLHSELADDQAGLRPDFSTVDHLWTIGQVAEKAEEWRMSVWAAALDYK